MYVSAYIHPKWFESEGDGDLHFLKQIDVDHVDISLNLIKGYEATGTFEKSDLAQLIDRLLAGWTGGFENRIISFFSLTQCYYSYRFHGAAKSKFLSSVVSR